MDKAMILTIVIAPILMVIAYLGGRANVVAEEERSKEEARNLKSFRHDLEPGSDFETSLRATISRIKGIIPEAFAVTLRGVGLAERAVWSDLALGPGITKSWGSPEIAQMGFCLMGGDSRFLILRLTGYADLLVRMRIGSLPNDVEWEISVLPCYITGSQSELAVEVDGRISIVASGATASSPKIVLYDSRQPSDPNFWDLDNLLKIERPGIHHLVHGRMVELDALAAATLAELVKFTGDHRGRGPTMITAALTKYLGGDRETAMTATRAILARADEEEVRRILGIERPTQRRKPRKEAATQE